MKSEVKNKRRRRPSSDNHEIISLTNVSKTYSTGAPALNGVDLHINRGEFVFIVGDSGSGKSTMIKLLLRELVPTSGAFAQRIIQVSGKEIKRNVPSILATVGLAGKYKAKPRQLSGGEQQRVAIARALVNRPSILLADEPTGNLDPKNSWEIMKLLEQINENGTTVLVVTHNREIVNAMQKRVVTMKKGVIVSDEEKGGYIDED